MRLLFLASAFVLACSALPAAAQSDSSSPTADNSSQERIALSSRPAANTSVRGMRLACAPLIGQVFEPNGKALIGATLLIKGTHQVYVTDAEGKFQITETVYEGQHLTVDAAGYNQLEVALDDCSLPRLVLEKDPTARIKRSGKRAGQVVRLNNRNTNLR